MNRMACVPEVPCQNPNPERSPEIVLYKDVRRKTNYAFVSASHATFIVDSSYFDSGAKIPVLFRKNPKYFRSRSFHELVNSVFAN